MHNSDLKTIDQLVYSPRYSLQFTKILARCVPNRNFSK